MTKLDEQRVSCEQHIATVQRHVNEMHTAAQYRPSVVSDEDVSLMERILEGWRTHSSSLATPGNS
jgi:hypothetical protein